MSLHGLQLLVARTVISEDFRAGVLNGRRAEMIEHLDLDGEEAGQVMAIHCDSLPEFANGVLEIMEAQYPKPEPLWHRQRWSVSDPRVIQLSA